MTIKDDIAKVEGLLEALKNEIEVWFEKHFGDEHAEAKTDLQQTLGIDTAASASTTPTTTQS